MLSIGKEDGYFDMNDIIGGICNKMINRHPHVFGDSRRSKLQKMFLESWDELKKKEKGFNTLQKK